MTPSDSPTPSLDRYQRQIRYPRLGLEGQRRLAGSVAVVCGCGALGSTVANWLVRAGVGNVRIVDRDFVETTNLHRQALFDEEDVAAELPKAVAAAEKLRRINSQVRIEPVVADLGPGNIENLCAGADVIVDGTDNFQTRFLINDFALRQDIPWIYGGCLGAEGQSMTILPRQTACLRCLMPECPPPGSVPTCDTAGILGPVVGMIASVEAGEAIKILSGHRESVSRSLTVIDMWDTRVRQVNLASLRDQVDCPACYRGEFPWLSGKQGSQAAVLCGRNAVQLTCPDVQVPLDQLAQRLEGLGPIRRNPFLLRFAVDGFDLTIFSDGRAIIGGTDDPATARAIHAKYIGQ